MPFFDLQVNGYGGVDFNQDDLSLAALRTACERLRADAFDGILATIITESLPVMCARLRRLVELREQDTLIKQMIAGIHIEGPFINATDGYRGAHPRDAVLPPNIDSALELLDAAGGLCKIMTLAPERDLGLLVTRRLVREGVIVSAGHCDATLDKLRAAIDAGLTMFTHLGNGCPMLMHRHDNIVQRVLSLTDQLWVTFIADGAHVAFPALKNYLQLVGLDRAIITTDAVAPAGLGPGNYTMGRWSLTIGDDLVARSPDGSHLVGAAMSMPRVARNLIEQLGLSEHDVQKLTSDNPRRAIGLDSISMNVPRRRGVTE